jgi:hypothetical protein
MKLWNVDKPFQQQFYILAAVLTATLGIMASGTTNTKLIISFIVVLFVTVGIFSFAIWMTFRDVHKMAGRLGEIELQVNDRAGEELLQWERYWGGLANGILFNRGLPLPRPDHLRLNSN